MRKYLSIISVFLLFSVVLPSSSEALSPAEVFKRFSPSVGTLLVDTPSGKRQGTGFLVSAGGDILTNYHVIAGAQSIIVHFSDEKQFGAERIIAQDPEKDLALLQINVRYTIPHLAFNPQKLPEGTDIVVIGTPKGLEKTISTGIVSGHRNMTSVSYIQITAPISSGSSGSPVFDAYGKVIGIAVGGIKDSQGLNFAVAAKDISEFLRTRPFKEPRAKISSTSKFVPDKTKVLSFVEIMALLNKATVASPIASVKQNLGPPHETEKKSASYNRNLWSFKQNSAVLLVWDRKETVERSELLESHSSPDDAKQRFDEALRYINSQFGQPQGKSQNGYTWNRKGHVFSLEKHVFQEAVLILFKITH